MSRKPDYIDVGQTFGVDINGPDNQPLKLPGYSQPGPNTPKRPKGYRHKRAHLAKLGLAYLRGTPMALSGPTGSGKTELVIDFLAGLGREPIIKSSSQDEEVQDLIGQRVPDERGHFVWVDGPLTTSLREGRPFIHDELDRNPPGLLTKLNHVLDGHPLYIDATGEKIEVPDDWWYVATMNTRGHGDDSGSMVAAAAQDQAFMARFVRLWVDYPRSIEQELANEILDEDCASQMATRFVEELRSSDVDCPAGTRQLVRFCQYWCALAVPEQAAEMVFAHAASPTQAVTVASVFRSIWGDGHELELS